MNQRIVFNLFLAASHLIGVVLCSLFRIELRISFEHVCGQETEYDFAQIKCL